MAMSSGEKRIPLDLKENHEDVSDEEGDSTSSDSCSGPDQSEDDR
jgi:hypothetical protein